MPVPLDQKEHSILHYLLHEGYATKRMIAYHLEEKSIKGTSLPNVQAVLRGLRQRNILKFKELHDNKEHAYCLSERGLQITGYEKREITDYNKLLSRIKKDHLQHYWYVRSFEKSLHKAVEESLYTIASTNEFNDDDHLHIKMPEGQIRSDGEIKILHDGWERLVLRVEMDTGCESIVGKTRKGKIRGKFDNYALYLASSRVNTEYQTQPIYILFVTPQNRIESILTRLGKHEIMPYLLFMPLERLQEFTIYPKWGDYLNRQETKSELRKEFRRQKHPISTEACVEVLEPTKRWKLRDQEHQVEYTVRFIKKGKPLAVIEDKDLFSLPVLTDSKGKQLSLSSVITQRESLLTFYHAAYTAGKQQHGYEVFAQTIFSTPKNDPFFPMMIDIEHKTQLWQPHGYLKIRKKLSGNKLRDAMFLLVLAMENAEENLAWLLKCYDAFMQQKNNLQRITELPCACGCLIIAANQEQIGEVFKALDGLAMKKRTRVIAVENCTAEKIFNEPVWVSETGDKISLFR